METTNTIATKQGSQLAVLGGTPVFDRNVHRKWPEITEAEKTAVMRVLDRGILSGSDAPEARALQDEFAAYAGTKHALLCHSGTSALQVAIGAVGIGEGDEVIIPAYSFVATALAVIQQGAVPIFVDVDEWSGNMDASKIEAAITSRTKAIMPVHVHGCPFDIDQISAIAKKHNLILLEDAAQAHGATFGGTPVGNFGMGAGFSLQSSKNFSAGEGGIYVTNSDEHLERANQIRNFSQNLLLADREHYNLDRPLDGHKALESLGIGSMYRGNEMMAAFARAQLARLPEKTRLAQANAERLSKRLNALPGIRTQRIGEDRKSVHHKFRVWFDTNELGSDKSATEWRSILTKALHAEGCEVVLWQTATLPSFPLFKELRGFGKGFPFSSVPREHLEANYRDENFAQTKRMLDSSFLLFSQTCPFIAQDTKTVDLYADAFEKVWSARKDLARKAV